MKNYLFDLYPNFPNDFSLHNRLDPDCCSKDLYDDLRTTFFSEEQTKLISISNIEIRQQRFGKSPAFYTMFVDGNTHLLSSDYIGPSVYWAAQAGLSEDEIINYLRISRTLGGHVVFPRGENSHVTYYFPPNRFGNTYPMTINNARGGKKGYYDRFDLTLFALKQLFVDKEISNMLVKKAWLNYSDWFDLFKNDGNGFKTFIDFFKLNDFVDKNYEVYDLTSYNSDTSSYTLVRNDSSWIPDTLSGYRTYVAGVNHAIKLRNNRLKLNS